MASLLDETQPVRNQQQFDETALAEALSAHVDGLSGDLAVLQMAGGQSNPTYLLSFPDRELVLRKQPPGDLLPSAHAVDREYRVLKALHPTDVPVPEPFWYCEDREIIGTPFYVMERMRGRILRENALPGMTPADRTAHYEAMNDALVRMHAIVPEQVGLGDYGKAGNYFARQTARLTKQYAAYNGSESCPSLDRLLEWLPSHIPEGDETTICHGDFRLENLMFHADRPEVIAIFDWELSTIGHPLADLGYNLIPHYLPASVMGGLLELDLPALGIPGAEAYAARYAEASGRGGVEPFHVAFACFRGAVILEGVAARGRAGNAAASNATEVGALGRHFADLACRLLELRY
jgi:aminoglycoside phosphotransferase (APT) family kinase protein